jgi:hypothetical protein
VLRTRCANAAAVALIGVVLSGLGIKAYIDRQAAIAEQQRQDEVRRQALLQQIEQQKFVEEQEQKAKALSGTDPRQEERWLKLYCANPSAYRDYTNLYKYAAEIKAKQLGQPVPTEEQVIAAECASVRSASSPSPSPSPSPTVSIEPVSPVTPSPSQ